LQYQSRKKIKQSRMLPSVVGNSLKMSEIDLNEYVAVPGKIIPIPGCDYVVISPDFERTNLLQRDVEEVPFQLQPPASSDKNGNNEDCINKNDADVIVCTGDTESNKNKELLPYSAQVRKRGRPSGKRTTCQCPNCKEEPNGDRHICHFENCGKTFTKKNHLDAHIRKHVGDKPFRCPHPGCGAAFTRSGELKRHGWIHKEGQRFKCLKCNRKFNRVDTYKRHSKLCKSSGFLDAIDVDAEDDPISVDVEDTNVADVDDPIVEEVN